MKHFVFLFIIVSGILFQSCSGQKQSGSTAETQPVTPQDTVCVIPEENIPELESEDEPSFVAMIMEFYGLEDAQAFIQEHNIADVKTIEAIEGPFYFLVMPASKNIQLRLTNAEYDEYFNFFEGPELYGEALTGCPILFSYSVPEGIPAVVVTAADEVGRHSYWHPEYSGLDGHLITNSDFLLLGSAYEDVPEDEE